MHELQMRRKDGAIRVFEFSVQLLAGGSLMLTISRDATERRDAEAQLQANEQRFRAAIESMTDTFALASPVRSDDGEIIDFRWEYVNDAYCALVGLSANSSSGSAALSSSRAFPTANGSRSTAGWRSPARRAGPRPPYLLAQGAPEHRRA